MSFPNWCLPAKSIFSAASVMPVLVIKEMEQALPLAEALFNGGIKVLEVTLRTPIAFEVVRLLTSTFPDALIGVGTVTTPAQLHDSIKAGARFAISPGQTQELLLAGREASIPFIPGIASISELMMGLSLGFDHFKFFPAAVAGGIPMLRSIYGPFPHVRFCPTGGINQDNYKDYLAQPNVSCVGGSWIVPDDAIQSGNWQLITDLCVSTGL